MAWNSLWALAAVATGAVLVPAELPGPEAGTAEQAEPNGWSAVFALDAPAAGPLSPSGR